MENLKLTEPWERDLITDRKPLLFHQPERLWVPRTHHFRHCMSHPAPVTGLSVVLTRTIGEGTEVSFSNDPAQPGAGLT